MGRLRAHGLAATGHRKRRHAAMFPSSPLEAGSTKCNNPVVQQN